MKIMLALPFFQVGKHTFSGSTVGYGYINAVLRNSGFDVTCFAPHNLEKEPVETLQSSLVENEIDIVLCGGLTSQYVQMKKLFDAVRTAKRKVITIGGGGGFTSEPILFSEMLGVDYAIIGEGEISICELLNAIINGSDVSKINGIVYKTIDGYIQTNNREPIMDLDSLPFPSYEGFPIEQELKACTPFSGFNTYYCDEPRIIPICYSRSCPFKCSFCFHPVGDRYRSRSLDNFFSELDLYVRELNINGIVIVDEMFKMDDSVFEFCRRIKPYKLNWVVSLVAKTVTYEKLVTMKEAGCSTVSYGIESMSEAVLRDMHKPTDIKTIEHALAITRKAGISVQGNLIFGAEAETTETLRETLGWWLKHREYQLALNIVTPYPGSRYYHNCVHRGIIRDKKEYIELGTPWVNMSKLSDWEFERIIQLISLPPEAKIAWDFSCHSEIVEVIPNYKNNPGRVSMQLKCWHCGEIHTYGNLPKQLTRYFYMPCRNCGGLSTYGEPVDYNIPVLQQLVKNHTQGISIKDYFFDGGYKNVVIYGLGYLGTTLYKLLENSGLQLYATDRNPDRKSDCYAYMKRANFIAPTALADYPIDVLIVTPTYGYNDIIKYLKNNGYTGKCESLFNMVFGLTGLIG
jgi:radical SAM superfamily enzyme YgiQ (UPF0313 family)